MVRRSRAGFELSINTLVVIILGIAIIAGGIILISRLTNSSENVATDLTAEQRSELQNLMREGQLVAFYPAVQTVSAGKSAVFALGVKNALTTETNFQVDGMLQIQDDTGADKASSFDVVATPPKVPPGEQRDSLVLITPKEGTPAGTYTVIFTLSYLPTVGNMVPVIYDSPRFVTLKVE